MTICSHGCTADQQRFDLIAAEAGLFDHDATLQTARTKTPMPHMLKSARNLARDLPVSQSILVGISPEQLCDLDFDLRHPERPARACDPTRDQAAEFASIPDTLRRVAGHSGVKLIEISAFRYLLAQTLLFLQTSPGEGPWQLMLATVLDLVMGGLKVATKTDFTVSKNLVKLCRSRLTRVKPDHTVGFPECVISICARTTDDDNGGGVGVVADPLDVLEFRVYLYARNIFFNLNQVHDCPHFPWLICEQKDLGGSAQTAQNQLRSGMYYALKVILELEARAQHDDPETFQQLQVDERMRTVYRLRMIADSFEVWMMYEDRAKISAGRYALATLAKGNVREDCDAVDLFDVLGISRAEQDMRKKTHRALAILYAPNRQALHEGPPNHTRPADKDDDDDDDSDQDGEGDGDVHDDASHPPGAKKRTTDPKSTSNHNVDPTPLRVPAAAKGGRVQMAPDEEGWGDPSKRLRSVPPGNSNAYCP